MKSLAEDRLGFIDALRGIAAAYVVLFHLAHIPNPRLATPVWASRFIDWGGSGVTLFFVISAFTLTYMSRIHAGEPHVIKRFYARRFFRIAPLFYAWLIFYIIYAFLRTQTIFSALKIFCNVFFVFNLVPGWQNGIVAASWTIGVEMLFYLIFPLIYKFVDSLWKSVAFFVITVILARAFAWLVVSYHLVNTKIATPFVLQSIITKLPVFILGMVIYYFYELIRNKQSHFAVGMILIVISLCAYGLLINGWLAFSYPILASVYWQALVYGLLVSGLSIFPWSVLVNRVTRFWGEISYSMYLGHPIIISFVAAPLIKSIYALQTSSNFIKYGLSFLFVFSIVLTLSWLTYRFIEKPGIQYGKTLIKKYWSV